MSTEEHHSKLSELGFTIQMEDLPYLNEYQGDWAISGPEQLPNNYWLVTFDGKGHPVQGSMSPQQILDWGKRQGWECAYVAPYGRYVEGQYDGVRLDDWLRDRRRKHKQDHVH
ncbi:MAG: hypothetical protein A2201_10130 [Alicyclobacillus sp. RIFOXYA1_FULL_53_8]|nr:MAG: hypothetical protein A2201_10130 [Alicyclobacillus sp. RIFOXYA1_FULL_53_8]